MPCKSSVRLISAVALLAAGCASPAALPVEQTLKDNPKAERPTALRVAIAPVAVERASAVKPASEDERWSPVPVDPQDLGAAIKSAVDASGAFGKTAVFALDATKLQPAAPAGAAPAD